MNATTCTAPSRAPSVPPMSRVAAAGAALALALVLLVPSGGTSTGGHSGLPGPGWLAVIALRLLVPLTILRWPLLGGTAAFLADTFDVVLLDRLGVADYGAYNAIDKALDTYYLALEAWTCLAWNNAAARFAGLTLFAYRLVGAALYEATGERAVLVAFPNLFEAFFMTYLLVRRLGGEAALRPASRIVGLNLLLLVPKELQEYALHVAQVPVYAWMRDLVLIPLRIVG